MPSQKGKGLHLFGLLSRHNSFVVKTTSGKVDSSFVSEQVETLASSLQKITVIVLDNARIHSSAKVQACREAWEQRGLFIFYLPAYSPQLNLIDILWRTLKYEGLSPPDYLCENTPFDTITHILAAVGVSLTLHFADFEACSN